MLFRYFKPKLQKKDLKAKLNRESTPKKYVMIIKRYFFSCLIILLTGVMYFPLQAQQKKGTSRANFSGEWKSKESISMGGNIYCAYSLDDRMSSKTMKIANQAHFLTIETPSASPEAAPTTSHEKLTFDGKEGQVNYGPGSKKMFNVMWSADGQTMTVYSISHQGQVIHYVTEVWKLSNDGKSISVQANAKSSVWDEERSWKTEFEKTN